MVGPGGVLLRIYVSHAWAPFKAPDPLDPLKNGSIVVDYLVLLELPFSVQLENEYEKEKIALKEELQKASKNSCLNNQSELRLWALGWREGSASQSPSQPVLVQTGVSWVQVPTL